MGVDIGAKSIPLVIERALVTIAALAALVPLFQFWEERRFDRIVNLITTGNECQEWLLQVWRRPFALNDADVSDTKFIRLRLNQLPHK